MSLFETIIAILTVLVTWWSPAVPPTLPTESVTAPVVSVIDGDTIIVSLGGIEETVRYIGIDTPEPKREGRPECGSSEATEYNRQLVEGETVRLESDVEDKDTYGRLLRYVYATDEQGVEVFINKELIRAGLARPLTIQPNDAFAADFSVLAQRVQSDQIGSWALCPDF